MEINERRKIVVPKGSKLSPAEYLNFLREAYLLLRRHAQYLSAAEGLEALELAHVIPAISETVLAIYVGINDAVCNKGLVAPFLLRHAHNNVFVFDPAVYAGGRDVPSGTIDARKALNGFQPPNASWNRNWTYAMIADPKRTVQSLWQENGYIDMIAAKLEDFTLFSDSAETRVCFYIDPKAFDHPVNAQRKYLKDARRRGTKMADRFQIPRALAGEVDGLTPVVLNKGEKLFVARPDFAPCAHAWCNIHPDNKEWAVVNENSAVPLDLVVAKPPVKPQYGKNLIPSRGSADLTTDWHFRGDRVVRRPLLEGMIKG
jgi:hypothetical protein